jgi:hypothetical protein
MGKAQAQNSGEMHSAQGFWPTPGKGVPGWLKRLL